MIMEDYQEESKNKAASGEMPLTKFVKALALSLEHDGKKNCPTF